MIQQTLRATFGGALHDVGKPVYRNGAMGTHSQAGYTWLKPLLKGDGAEDVLNCVRYHHSQELSGARLPEDSIAYIVYLADNISAAADRRKNESDQFGFDRNLPLQPVFTHLNGEHPDWALSPMQQDANLRMPMKAESGTRLKAEDYQNLLNLLKDGLAGISIGQEWVDSLLCLMEVLFSSIPSSTSRSESPDISLFDHLKTTAAVSACISEYLLEKKITNYRKTLLEQEKKFASEPVFLLYSADFSGIQKFIYTVSTKNALKALRSRSFFLELSMEHYIDEMLSGCGVSRANLLYSGGGHCYLLLPNTQRALRTLECWNERFNDWLMENFGTSLYLAHGWTPCSANDLTNQPNEEQPYQAMFRKVSAAIARKKTARYSPAQLLRLNRGSREDAGRECRVCGRSDRLIPRKNGEGVQAEDCVCTWCDSFEQDSREIVESPVFLVTREDQNGRSWKLPALEGMVSLCFTDEKAARSRLARGEKIVRVYTKNKAFSGMNYASRIFIGDYAFDNSMNALAEKSAGIKRIGVCRMDVDNLGQAFVSGFARGNAGSEDRDRYVTISRTAAFSRQMSLFFKMHINAILSGTYGDKKPLCVTIVYSGGDDIFLVGAWNDAIEAGRRIRAAFRAYSCGSLTISGGIGLFDDHFPIRLAAEETHGLEQESKEQEGKDSFTLFARDEGQVYHWDEFEKEVIGEKMKALKDFFKSPEQTERGNTFLYRLLMLLREAETERINLARYAYTLARLEPGERDPAKAGYQVFSKKMYDWALNEKHRRELITAIYLFVYENRKETGKHDE